MFWGLVAVVPGPALGLSASWVRAGHPALAPLGTGALAGVPIGEGMYGLAVIADTTSPPYWWAELTIGVALMCMIAALRLRTPRSVGLAVLTTMVISGLDEA